MTLGTEEGHAARVRRPSWAWHGQTKEAPGRGASPIGRDPGSIRLSFRPFKEAA